MRCLSNICSECSSSYYLSSETCIPKCSDYSIYDTVTETCLRCVDHCHSCYSAVSCVECEEGYWLHFPTQTCFACLDHCLICDGSENCF